MRKNMMCPFFVRLRKRRLWTKAISFLEIIQYDPTDYFIDGNGQFTFLIGKGVLDVLLRHGREGVASVSGIDVFIDTSLPIAAPVT